MKIGGMEKVAESLINLKGGIDQIYWKKSTFNGGLESKSSMFEGIWFIWLKYGVDGGIRV